ncbi:hypothetical protein SAMN04487912_104119 [Arthrobacter sp. cf158]|uniref:hypothetical protein n=1 Tax=Arthrobacter sp. cf158 TaxID=1761744 RepID=UPI000899E3EB|nr:hypothetical protein [Arthrobacter sp. cf158]SDW69494.1 hypothetical protein SAMN04487912_104119 [Arthrobacter sp. cf158]
MSSLDSQILWTIATIFVILAATAGLLGFTVAFVRNVFLSSPTASDPWRFYPKLKLRWAKSVRGSLPRIVRDQRELILDLKTNTSTAAGLAAWGFGALTFFVPALMLFWKFEAIRTWIVFIYCVVLAVGFGAFCTFLTFHIPQRLSPKRRLLDAGLRLAHQARVHSPRSSAKDRRSISSSGRVFLDSARQLGIPEGDRSLRRISRHLAVGKPRSYSKINRQVAESAERLIRQVYEGEFEDISSPRAGALLSAEIRRRMAALSSLPVVVVIVGAVVGWMLTNVKLNP